MNRIFRIWIIGVFSLLLGCNKSEDISKSYEEGIYSGTFTVTYSSEKLTGAATLTLESGKYICTGNSNRIPAGGSGNYSIDGSKITFEDVNSWTADFDGNLILNGEYDYEFDGQALKISAIKNGVGYYEYDLKKQ